MKDKELTQAEVWLYNQGVRSGLKTGFIRGANTAAIILILLWIIYIYTI